MTKFNFKGNTEALIACMRQLERWDDVESFIGCMVQEPWHGYKMREEGVVEYWAAEYEEEEETYWLVVQEEVVYTLANHKA